MNNTGTIQIRNDAQTVCIDIDGIIGIPEWNRFSDPEEKANTYAGFKAAIEQIKSIEQKQIVVNIRSAGGNVNDALLIYDALKELNTDITTKCYGCTASAATIIAQAASRGKRLISRNALYLIHKSYTETEGNFNDMQRTVSMLEKTDLRIAGIYAENAGKDTDFYLELMNRQNGNGEWLSPQEAVDAQLADEIFNPRKKEIKALKRINAGLPTGFHYPAIPPDKVKRKSLFSRWMQELSDMMELFLEDSPAPENPKIKPVEKANALAVRLDRIEIETLQESAFPTKTIPLEDPPLNSVEASANELSYQEDMRLFNESL